MLKRILLKSVKYYLPILILSVLAVLWLYIKEHKNLISKQQDELSNKKQLIVELLKPMIANLYYWEQHSFDEDDFKADKNAYFDARIGDFIIGMDNYSQFRLINLERQEVYRLDRQEYGKIVKSTALQNKAEREYYKATIDIKKSQIYLTPLNLNQENGVLELLYKPMVRAVAPVFDSSANQLGIVVINFSTEKLLDLPKKEINYSFMMLDRFDNYLVSEDYKKEFGHLIPNSRNITLYEELPELADSLRTKKSTSLFRNGDLWIKTQLESLNSGIEVTSE